MRLFSVSSLSLFLELQKVSYCGALNIENVAEQRPYTKFKIKM